MYTRPFASRSGTYYEYATGWFLILTDRLRNYRPRTPQRLGKQRAHARGVAQERDEKQESEQFRRLSALLPVKFLTSKTALTGV